MNAREKIHCISIETIEDGLTIRRGLVVVEGYAFYKSSGTSSELQNIWLPIVGIKEEWADRIEKPPVAYTQGTDEDTLIEYFGKDKKLHELLVGIKGLRKSDRPGLRFGNLKALLLSLTLDEKSWDSCEKLSALKKHIHSVEEYQDFIRTHNNQIEEKPSVIYNEKSADFSFSKVKEALAKLNHKHCVSVEFPGAETDPITLKKASAQEDKNAQLRAETRSSDKSDKAERERSRSPSPRRAR